MPSLNCTTHLLAMNLEKLPDDEKWAIITVTRQGVEKAREMAQAISEKSPDIITIKKYQSRDTKVLEGSFKDGFKQVAQTYNVLVCIMATGIVVRAMAPLLKHKALDPAVLVVDPKGEYVISLLSGHLGGANEATRYLAAKLGAQAVITTATDVLDSMAVDTLAQALNGAVENFVDAKTVTALILDGQPVEFLNRCEYPVKHIAFPENFGENISNPKARVVFTDTMVGQYNMPTAVIVPKAYVLGIGCRRHTKAQTIIENIHAMLEAENLYPQCIAKFATIGLKADEKGLLEACKHFGAKLTIVPDAMIKTVESKFQFSDLVYRTTGLGSVCEPAGYVVSGFGDCRVSKIKGNGMTLSLWKINESILKHKENYE